MRTWRFVETSARTWRPPQRAVAVAVALLFAGFLFSNAIRHAAFLLFAGFLLAVVLDYPVRFVARFVRRSIAAAIVFFLIAGSIAGAVAATIPMMTEQAGKIAKEAPGALDKAEVRWNELRRSADVTAAPTSEAIKKEVRTTLGTRAGEVAKKAIPVAGGIVAAFSTALLVLVIATFMVASPETYADGIVRLVPHQQEKPTREFLGRAVNVMRGWMTAQLISMVFVGVATAIGLLVIGVKGWLVLAIVNFFCEFVPFLGPFVGAVPGVAVAFADSSRTGLYALLLYVGIQQLEGFVVSPLAMRREVSLAPPVLLAWQLLMGTAFGLPGILLATPVLAMVKVAIDFFWVERTLGKAPEPQAA